MNLKLSLIAFNYLIISLFILNSCTNDLRRNIQIIKHQPKIEPDYSDVTIPPNIAPLNFIIKESGNEYQVILKSGLSDTQISLRSKDGVIQLPDESWKKLIEDSKGDKITIQVLSAVSKNSINKYEPISISVANEPIDPYLAYRLIPPGYYSWSDIKIEQRSLESFDMESVIENQIIEKNCVNCHSFNQNNPDQFLVHIRGSKGGTYFVDNDKITKTNLKTEQMLNGATYPSWHPRGRFVAFSSNQVRQSFYAHYSKSIEVYDESSSLILYDTQKNEVIGVPKNDSGESLQTFPTWSPDGKTLYYCEAYLNDSVTGWEIKDIENIHYNLVKKSFNEADVSFGKTDIVVNATETHQSVSFPRISPDGNFLIFTMADYGTFPIWHKEADLYMFDLHNGKLKKMELNSDETDSYHSWSTNSKWLVFSSKRIDGRSTRPFIAYVNSWDQIGKPFVLPQNDPAYYDNQVLSFNIPEFIKGKIKMNPRDFEAATKNTTIQAKSGKFENAKDGKAKRPRNSQPEIPNSIHE